MNKCFITKLPSSIDNDNLPVLGQLRIKWLKQDSLTDNDVRAIRLQTNDSIIVKVSGAHFTDNTLTSNVGNIKTIKAANGLVTLYVSNDVDAVLTIDNKYSLTYLQCNIEWGNERGNERSMYFDIEDIKYCTNLNRLVIASTHVSGDISALSKLTNLTKSFLSNTQVSGDIKNLSTLVNLTELQLDSTNVSGDIKNLSTLVNLTELQLPKNTDMTTHLKDFLIALYNSGRNGKDLHIVKYDNNGAVWNIGSGASGNYNVKFSENTIILQEKWSTTPKSYLTGTKGGDGNWTWVES